MGKVIIVNTSPRKDGNCAVITERLALKLDASEVTVVPFMDSDINYCLACDYCKKQDTVACFQKDGMAALLAQLDACDALVLLTPVYWGEFSAQAKTFVDRFYAFFNPTKPNMSVASKVGKKLAIITTNGMGPAEVYAHHSEGVAKSLGVAGFTESRVLAFDKINALGSIAANEADMAQVDDLAAWLSA